MLMVVPFNNWKFDLTLFARLADGGHAVLIQRLRTMPEKEAAENDSRLIESERSFKTNVALASISA